MTALLLLLVLSIAFANGSNDVSKGVGTLVGSGLATYRRGLAWGTVWTVGGALAAMLASNGLVKTFSTGLLRTSPAEPDRFLLAVSVGVFVWVIFASWMSLPVSTTHAMIGAIIGAALAMDGLAAIQWPLLTMLVITPLALGPVVAGSLTYVIHAAISGRLSAASQYCVCVKGGIDIVRVVPSGGAATGSYLYGRRVTNTLAEKVATIDPFEGLSASFVSSMLVLLASFIALPVSTTHVSTGAIIGAGLRGDARALRWNTVAAAAMAWLVTLPVAALVAAFAWKALGF